MPATPDEIKAEYIDLQACRQREEECRNALLEAPSDEVKKTLWEDASRRAELQRQYCHSLIDGYDPTPNEIPVPPIP